MLQNIANVVYICNIKRLENDIKATLKQLASYKKKQLQFLAIIRMQKECQIISIMITYTNAEQARILNSCNSATELMETKELLEELQPISHVTQLVYDRMMIWFILNNKIVWILQN
jgi:hypothetical protein